LQDKLSVERLDQLICGLTGLGAWSPAAASVLDLLAGVDDAPDRRADLSEALSNSIALDPALTAGLLSLANRGRGTAPTSVRGAVEKLSFDVVQAEMLAGQGFVVSTRQDAGDQFDNEAFNRHCLAVAVAAEKLAAFGTARLDPDHAFMCGLLHDLGKLVLVQTAPKSYQRAVQASANRRGDISEYERQTVGVDHSVAGLHLARHWRLGSAVQAVAWLSHQPSEAIPESIGDRHMVQIVALADTIARECNIGFSGNFQFIRSSAQLASQMGLADDIPVRIAESLAGEVQDMLAPLCSGSPHQQAAAYQGAVLRANSKLGELNRVLRSGAQRLQSDSVALDGLRRFAASVSPDALLPETLGQLAGAVAGAISATPSEAEPIIAYCRQQDTESVVLVISSGGEHPVVQTARCNPQFDSAWLDQADASAAEAMVRVLANIDEIRQWIDPGVYEHYRLVCDGAWIGGVLAPSAPDGRVSLDDSLEAMGEVLSLTLALARGQSLATRLSEQLAGAGQVLAATQETLAEARTIAAMGEMAAGVGHELNNPLTVISVRAQLMRDRASNPEERKTWTQIADQAHRISDIITDLMDFASPRRAKPDVVDVDALTAEVSREFAASEDPVIGGCKIIVAPPSEPLNVLADIAQIRAALREVVTNAAIAANVTGNPAVRISSQAGESGDEVLIVVSDKGPGMDARTLSSVFTPFFSAQEAGRRVGLGLPRAQRYVMNNGGRIWIQTHMGEGTTVFIELPRADR
jgi:signal transduction histidine kinase/HD-like signal output (HDOD) protein